MSVFGIDLGTTRTSIALVTPVLPERGWFGSTEVVQLADGFMTPSAVLFDADTVSVGSSAKNMGHRSGDCAQVFKREMPNLDYVFRPNSRPGETYNAEDLSQILLSAVTSQAQERTGMPVEDVVITVPAYFGDVERRRTRQAGERAGLKVLDIINEPTAALLAYLFQPGAELIEEPVLVFDLGGGTFDTVVVNVAQNLVQVAAIYGDLLLGGRDFDSTIAFELAIQFMSHQGDATPPTSDLDANARLMLDVERVRENLSAVNSTNLAVWGGGPDANRSYNAVITRTELEKLLGTQIDRCIDITRRALDEAKTNGVVPTRVLFVGGTTRMPIVRERVLREFGLAEIQSGADPDLLVAKGAALWAQKLTLEAEAQAILGRSSLAAVDWADTESRSVVVQLATSSGMDRGVVSRLLQLGLQTVTSRGYAIRCYSPENDEHFLAYMADAQQTLPFTSEPNGFTWNNDIDSWILQVYEDSAEHTGTRDPDLATLVEVVRGETNRTWPKGSSFLVTVEIGTDQVIHMHAWHELGDAPGGELRAVVDPAKPRT